MSEQQRLRYTELAPEGVGAMRGVEHYLNVRSGLPPVLLEMVRLRASQMNRCEYCMGLHAHELRKHNEPESRIGAVAEWSGSDAFTERERAALAWTEVVTDLADHVSEAAFCAVREHFDDAEIVNLTMAIASINAWNRLGVAFRPQWDEAKAAGGGAKRAAADGADAESASPDRSISDDGERAVIGDDGGKVSVDGD